jgi:hypothetical protein
VTLFQGSFIPPVPQVAHALKRFSAQVSLL